MNNEIDGRIEDPREAEYIAYQTKQLEEDYLNYIQKARQYGIKGVELYFNIHESRMNFSIQRDYMNLAQKTRHIISEEIIKAQQEYYS